MDSDTRNIARWMIWLGWLIFLILLTYFFNNMLENDHNPNQEVSGSVTQSGVKEVVLTRNRQGQYLSSGFINGQAVVFILDTGASDVAIPANVARRLDLSGQRPVVYQTANGPVSGMSTKLDTVSLGNITLHNIRGGINPAMHKEYILLGMSFLKHLEFTQRGNELILRQYPGGM
ncbi:MAG: TIGR02281 family clan AA aspartic protease [Gammaproteobacteria bacterium]|nr:TIGR02281 family clan AA aspartic protease [Gammaproteobacteria bacterium]